MNDTGGPAFPFVFDDTATRSRQVYTGMSIRDWFAGKAMLWVASDLPVCEDFPRRVAEFSYAMADAMLKERSKE